MNNSVRNTTKKLKTYESKYPGVVDEKHEELRRNVIIANLSVARHEEKMKKVEERVLFNAITDDEFLDQSFQQNASLNLEKELKEQKASYWKTRTAPTPHKHFEKLYTMTGSEENS